MELYSTFKLFSLALGARLFTSLLLRQDFDHLGFVSFVHYLLKSGLPLPIVMVDDLRRLGYSQVARAISRQCCVIHNYFAH